MIGDLLAAVPDLKIVVLSGQNDDENARRARTLGAIDFLGKPCDPGRLLAILDQALRFGVPSPVTDGTALIGASLPMQKLRHQVEQYAHSSFPVLIQGESGSGKDIIASVGLHRQTPRRHEPFLALNCAAISPSLVEPTLFGYAKGAFTGASAAKAGYFEEAGNGTLFLDEIGELPIDLQPKLLRVLENGEFQRVGETQTRTSRARIIAATNRDLRREVKAGRFRADLFHRLSVFTVDVPALRDMGEDRQLLLDHFRRLYAQQAEAAEFTLTPAATALWRSYPFPGNVRELRNIVIRLTAKYPGCTVGPEALAEELDDDDALVADASPPPLPGESGRPDPGGRRAPATPRPHRPGRRPRPVGKSLHRGRPRTLPGQRQPGRPPPGHQPDDPVQPDGKLEPPMSLYLEHFGLREPPFRITPHTDFFFTGANRGPTLQALIYAITQDEGIVKVSGEVGSGKTMLCRMLLERLPAQVETLYLANPSLSREEILGAIADELALPATGGTTHSRLRALQEALVERYAQGRRVVLLIDEAHAMPAESLEEIRLLSNLEAKSAKLLQIVLFAQPELDSRLAANDMRQLRERITQHFDLMPLPLGEIGQYIEFRLRAAGYRGPQPFTSGRHRTHRPRLGRTFPAHQHPGRQGPPRRLLHRAIPGRYERSQNRHPGCPLHPHPTHNFHPPARAGHHPGGRAGRAGHGRRLPIFPSRRRSPARAFAPTCGQRSPRRQRARRAGAGCLRRPHPPSPGRLHHLGSDGVEPTLFPAAIRHGCRAGRRCGRPSQPHRPRNKRPTAPGLPLRPLGQGPDRPHSGRLSQPGSCRQCCRHPPSRPAQPSPLPRQLSKLR